MDDMSRHSSNDSRDGDAEDGGVSIRPQKKQIELKSNICSFVGSLRVSASVIDFLISVCWIWKALA